VTKDEALKMAIDSLEMHVPHYIKDRGCKAIQACKEALETPECNTHPDAPHGFCRDASHSADRYVCECEFWEQPAQKSYEQSWYDTHPTPVQEPVAWGNPTYNYAVHHKVSPSWQGNKEFVGLSDDEREMLYDKAIEMPLANLWNDYAYLIEQALKEKNNE
jgi:hypothetical protein